MKKHWLTSLAVAAVVAMASANASAGDVLAAVTADRIHYLAKGASVYISWMKTPLFKHSGGPLIATYTAECAVAAYPLVPGGAKVGVSIAVTDAEGKQVASMSPAPEAFCSSSGETDLRSASKATHAVTSVATLPAGVYRVQVLGHVNDPTAVAAMGARSLVVSR